MHTQSRVSRDRLGWSSVVLLGLSVAGLLLWPSGRAGDFPVLQPHAEAQVAPPSLPRPDHIVIVFEENKDYQHIIGAPAAPYINSLASQGALFTQFYAEHHPSQ